MHQILPLFLAQTEPATTDELVWAGDVSGKQLLVRTAESVRDGVARATEALSPDFARQLESVLFAEVTGMDLLAAGVITAIVALAHLIIGTWLRRRARRCDQTDTTGWRGPLIRAAAGPLYLMLWIYGIFFALVPILNRLSPAGQTHVLATAADMIFDIGFFIALVWLFVAFTRVAERLAGRWTRRTESTFDDLLLPLIIRALRVTLPVLALIIALPVLGLPESYEDVLQKAGTLLLIGAIAWVLCQVVVTFENVVLAKYDVQLADNLRARAVHTQVKVVRKTIIVLIIIFTVAAMLMLFEDVRRLGTSIIASAGVLGIIVGFAAQRTISNLFAGLQIALTQPIRLDDVLIVEGEWGRVEEITLTYVVIRIWDLRRLVVPIQYFIDKPFQNWTRVSADILGTVFIYCDYAVPVDAVRAEIDRIVRANPKWDGKVVGLQVTNATEHAVELRALASAADASKAWDLRCAVREEILAYLQKHYPESLPRARVELHPQGQNGHDETQLRPGPTARPRAAPSASSASI